MVKLCMVEEVVVFVWFCNEVLVFVVFYGGGMGFVGGQVKGEGVVFLVILLECMCVICEVFLDENVLIVEVGVVFEVV